ncbi:MAG TPA: hypothetical protein VGI00_20780 [Streptosporangiaceae bacterium]|jgi:hypothetical protein
MSRTRRIIATSAVLATAGFGSLAAATLAGATTSHCAANPYCYTQEVHGTSLVMADSSGPAHDNAAVLVENQSSKSSASDFLAGLAPFPTTSNAKLFEYAPKGKLSGFCVSEPKSHAALVLRYCDGSANQAWDATQAGETYEWINEATGDAMTDGPKASNNPGNAGTQLTGQNVTGKANQLWDAVQN